LEARPRGSTSSEPPPLGVAVGLAYLLRARLDLGGAAPELATGSRDCVSAPWQPSVAAPVRLSWANAEALANSSDKARLERSIVVPGQYRQGGDDSAAPVVAVLLRRNRDM